ncbi:MAG: S41 family peptidase [Planctomycetota bacterium]
MPVLRPAPQRGRRRQVLAAWGLVAVAVGICGLSVRADAPLAPLPPAFPPDALTAAIPHEDLAARAAALVHQGRWSDVVSICETAARKGTLAPSLRHQYDLAKLHCDVARRHAEPAFRGHLATLAEVDARRLYSEVLARIESHHVDAPDFGRLVDRGLRAIDVGLDEPAFASTHAAQATPARRAVYHEQVARITGERSLASRSDAESVAASVARAAHSIMGIPPAVTLLEMTAAAVGGLDEYSAFLTTGQLDDLYAQIEGNFVGLGVELKSAPDGLLVVHVIPGSPAERAGIRASDHLVGVGGRSLAGMGVDEAAHLLQGPEGSLVTLAILRAPSPARAVTVRREHVEVPSIEQVRMLDPAAGIAGLKLTSFQKTTAADLEAALRRLDAAGMRSLVIDLRGNPGGLLSSAVDVADLFLDRGLVVATRGRSPDEDFNYSAGKAGTWRMPLVVLIDGDSASSSEIFAGAIRDHGRGTIVGSRSYGKGSIQGIFPLESSGMGIRLTTAKFFSPRGLPYSGLGVEPHVQVHAAAKPVDGMAAPVASDAALAAATDVARRLAVRPAAARPTGRSTAAR